MMNSKFERSAALLVETMKNVAGVSLSYDETSVAWLEGYIERQRTPGAPGARQSLTSLIGSFLGECIRRQFGGEWVENEFGWAVCFDRQNCIFPFNKVQKQFAHGSDESILSFYRSIPVMFKLTITGE
jgi:hypothetical protein